MDTNAALDDTTNGEPIQADTTNASGVSGSGGSGSGVTGRVSVQQTGDNECPVHGTGAGLDLDDDDIQLLHFSVDDEARSAVEQENLDLRAELETLTSAWTSDLADKEMQKLELERKLEEATDSLANAKAELTLKYEHRLKRLDEFGKRVYEQVLRENVRLKIEGEAALEEKARTGRSIYRLTTELAEARKTLSTQERKIAALQKKNEELSGIAPGKTTQKPIPSTSRKRALLAVDAEVPTNNGVVDSAKALKLAPSSSSFGDDDDDIQVMWEGPINKSEDEQG